MNQNDKPAGENKPADTRVVTCDPETIWPLPPDLRVQAVISLVSECADRFADATEKDDAKMAQEAAHAALFCIAGLFPDRSHNAHLLIGSLSSLLIQSRQGKREHILSRPGAFIGGLHKGPGNAYISGFAISAVQLLMAWGATGSEAKACKHVASLLAGKGVSLKEGEPGQSKPITASAIRKWIAEPETFALQHAMADRMINIHTQNLINRHAGEAADLFSYLADQAAMVVLEANVHQQ